MNKKIELISDPTGFKTVKNKPTEKELEKHYSNYLKDKAKRPKNYQDEYKPFYNGTTLRSLSLFVSNDAFIDFMTFSAVFKNYYHAFDYLIFTEKSCRIGTNVN